MSLATLEESEDSVGFLYDHEYFEETSEDVWKNCVFPSAASIFNILYKIILVNLIFGILSSTVKLPQTVFHILSGVSGMYLISNLESIEGKLLIFIFFTQSFVLLSLSNYIQVQYEPLRKYNDNQIRYLSISNIIKFTLIFSLVMCEYFILKTETWMEVRGVVMVFSMKLISLSEDIDKGNAVYPSFLKYFGYIFCGANVIFGPWISHQEYLGLIQQPTKKDVRWILGIIRALCLSMIFLTISNCWSMFFIPEYANRWLVGYREALSFRTSHYFISYLSEASMLAAGFKNLKNLSNPLKWKYEVVNPLKIEFPTSLSIVVTNWNRPMHDFLKKYVYQSWLPGGKFSGMLATFIISSFLHGFELKVSVVLISIGFFSYLQYAVRDYFAKVFNCCMRVHPCKQTCEHKLKRNSVICWICRLFFSFTSIVHLIFLGMIMDPSTDEIGILQKWGNLYFISFWMMLVNVLLLM